MSKVELPNEVAISEEERKRKIDKLNAIRPAIVKKTITIASSDKISISNTTQINVAIDMMHRNDFVSAKKYLDNMIKANPTDGEAYFLRFLASVSCADGEAFARLSSLQNPDFTDFEQALTYTLDLKRRKYFYDILFRNVMSSNDLSSYREFIELPESKEKEITSLSENMFNFAVNHVDFQIFDEVLRTVRYPNKFITLNLEFAHAVEKKYGEKKAIKYYKDILNLDDSNIEARWHVFWIESGANSKAILSSFIKDGAKKFEKMLFPYGFNEMVHTKLFNICIELSKSRPKDVCSLFDFLLNLIPEKNKNLYVSNLHLFIETMFKNNHIKYIKKYNELLLNIDKMDHEAYFNRVLIKHKFHNPFELIFIADKLMDDPDYFSAINAFAEKYPNQKNLYLDIHDSLKDLALEIKSKAQRKFIANSMYIQKDELLNCKDRVISSLDEQFRKAKRKVIIFFCISFLIVFCATTTFICLMCGPLFPYVMALFNFSYICFIIAMISVGILFVALSIVVLKFSFVLAKKGKLAFKLWIPYLVLTPLVISILPGTGLLKWNNCNAIPAYAFSNCQELKGELTIPTGVTSIENYAFSNCDGLTSVSIPNSVTFVGDGVFQSCDELTNVKLSNNMTTIGNQAFYGCDRLTSVSIPNTVTSIGNSAFKNCDSIESLTIPETVNSIGYNAFWNCSNLQSIFWNAKKCTKAGSTLQLESETTIYPIFGGRTHITTITFGKNVMVIPNYALSYCDKLSTIRYNGTIDEWNSIIKGKYWDYETIDYTVYCTDGAITKSELIYSYVSKN